MAVIRDTNDVPAKDKLTNEVELVELVTKALQSGKMSHQTVGIIKETKDDISQEVVQLIKACNEKCYVCHAVPQPKEQQKK